MVNGEMVSSLKANNKVYNLPNRSSVLKAFQASLLQGFQSPQLETLQASLLKAFKAYKLECLLEASQASLLLTTGDPK